MWGNGMGWSPSMGIVSSCCEGGEGIGDIFGVDGASPTIVWGGVDSSDAIKGEFDFVDIGAVYMCGVGVVEGESLEEEAVVV